MPSLHELQLLTDLRDEWGVIQILLGTDPEHVPDLEELSRELESIDPENVALFVAELLDLVEDTPAGEHVAGLQTRAAEGFNRVVRAAGGAQPHDVEAASVTAAGRELADAIRTSAGAEPMSIFFGTNRSWTNGSPGVDKAGLTLGRVDITIPVAAKETGYADVPRWWNRFSQQDPERFIVTGEIEKMSNSGDFTTGLAEVAAEERSNDVLVVVHGFNVDFTSAVRGAGQFGWNTRFNGPTVLFSWPSAGRLWHYGRDGDFADASTNDLANFLSMLAEGPWNRIHVLAHSMGNRVIVGALAAADLAPERIGAVTYVAPDVSRVVFDDRFPLFVDIAASHTLYSSDRDRAIGLSSVLASDRIGRIGQDQSPFLASGLETIVASRVRTGILSLGHSYHMSARPLMTDLEDVFNKGEAARDRSGLRSSPHGDWWFFPGE